MPEGRVEVMVQFAGMGMYSGAPARLLGTDMGLAEMRPASVAIVRRVSCILVVQRVGCVVEVSGIEDAEVGGLCC